MDRARINGLAWCGVLAALVSYPANAEPRSGRGLDAAGARRTIHKPTDEHRAAVGAHLMMGPTGPIGSSSVFLVHVSDDRRTALGLTVSHCDPRVGDPVLFKTTKQSDVRGLVTDVIAQSTRLDYSLVKLRFDKPMATRPIAVVGDHLPRAGNVMSAGWMPGGPNGLQLKVDWNESHPEPGVGRINEPFPARGTRDAVPLLAGALNPLLFFTPLGYVPLNIGPTPAPQTRRVTVAAFRLDGGPGMSGGPILDGAGRAVAHISGGGGKLNNMWTMGVPSALVVRDVQRRVGDLYGDSQALVAAWLTTVPHRVRGGRPFR